MSDVCLILEGTYPYITGGVSSCVYQLICETPELRYSILYIGASGDSIQEPKYPIPQNVDSIQEVFLYDYNIEGLPDEENHHIKEEIIFEFYKSMKELDFSKDSFKKIYTHLFQNPNIPNPMDILKSREAWNIIEKFYKNKHKDEGSPSFIDYFYTWRFTHFPLFTVLNADIPRASIYHSFCTGYAGIAAAVAKIKYNKPYILSEHGIYSHEREIEISMASWIHQHSPDVVAQEKGSIFKEWWINFFHFMGRTSYQFADSITSLYQGNVEKQKKYGAPYDKIQIIPNGVDFKKFSNLPKDVNKDPDKFIIGLVGRVVPIKDIKNFIKSIGIISNTHPNVEAWVIGPTDEDESYYDECCQMIRILDLDEKVILKGKVDMTEFYPKIDLLALTSISEGQPLVTLEAFCAGIPAVCTDVGACSEIIYGMNIEDKKIGAAGEVVPLGRPELFAKACKKIIEDPSLYKEMATNAKLRVEKYYTEEQNILAYTHLYNSYLKKRY